jgi:hypothetical protein
VVTTEKAVPVHHADYGVFTSPLSNFVAEMRRRGRAALVRTVGRGEAVDLFPASRPG